MEAVPKNVGVVPAANDGFEIEVVGNNSFGVEVVENDGLGVDASVTDGIVEGEVLFIWAVLEGVKVTSFVDGDFDDLLCPFNKPEDIILEDDS